jgi:hypothetical protein
MPHYEVLGADATTGQEMRLMVEAATPEDAGAFARVHYNLLVSEVTETPAGSAVADSPRSNSAEGGPARPATPPPGQPQTLDYRTTGLKQAADVPPHYRVILWRARMLRVLGYMGYTIGGLFLLAALSLFFLAAGNRTGGGGIVGAILVASAPATAGIGLCLFGFLLHTAAEILIAFRDIARNSFALNSEYQSSRGQ